MTDDAALILRCDGWEALITELARRPDLAFLEEIPRDTATAVLAAPAALALWIASRAPQLALRERLRVLVIGAETVDAPDEGRWYALLPRLLDRRFTVDATLVGDQLDPTFASAVVRFAPDRTARCLRTGIADFLRREDAAAFDLAIVFHPGMQKNRAWLEDGSLARIIAAGVPLVASSYEEDEFQMDRWVIECYGYAAAGEALLNPFFLELGDEHSSVRWGRALWQFAAPIPATGTWPDQHRLGALDLLTRMVMHSMTEVGTPSFNPGARVELESADGARLALVHIFDNHFVNPQRRKLLLLTPGGELRECGVLSAEEMSAYPATAARDIERAVWAARIKAERLLPPDSVRQGGGKEASTKAAAMLATLQERARRLFRR